MRQKYQISMNRAGTQLNIKELAIIDSHLNRVALSMLEEKNFSLLCEESYDNAAITNSMAAGIGNLVTTLRTINFFPNHQYATKIAEAVVALYASPGNGGIELIFDDRDLMKIGASLFPDA
jgi:hypothetical protein